MPQAPSYNTLINIGGALLFEKYGNRNYVNIAL